MRTHFYDIESLDNVFTLANYRAQDDVIEMYYLVDDPNLFCDNFEQLVANRIREKNKRFKGKVELYDLVIPESNYRLAAIFGLSDAKYVNNPNRRSNYPEAFRPVCDTDPDYDEDIHPFLMGYNSFNYDTTMLTLYLCDVISESNGKFVAGKTARSMRDYNDQLFSSQFENCMPDRLKYKTVTKNLSNGTIKVSLDGPDYKTPQFTVRKNMLMTGRHLDVAKLNEKQSKVGLKRILGMTGYQILESNKLRPGQDHIESADQLMDLFAYNVSDVIYLERLFLHKAYLSGFELKRQMLKDYPELVYDEAMKEVPDGNGGTYMTGAYKPDISPQTVRKDRLMIDSSSAQLATKALCPYQYLHDYDTVSFMYPSEAKAKSLGIPRVNVLEETRNFIYTNFPDGSDARKSFDGIYQYYKFIEGKNFNAGKNYLRDHGIDPDGVPNPEDLLPTELAVAKLSDAPKVTTCIFYYKADGTPSTCFVNFSIGGIHGAEYNQKLWEYDCKIYQEQLKAYNKKLEVFETVKKTYPNPCDLKIAKGITVDGVKYKPSDFLKPKATKECAFYKDIDSIAKPKEPILFLESKSERTGTYTYKLAPRYTWTSAAMTNHEDFTSYYPNMLRMMDAFFNEGLGYDRYGEIFDNKTLYGELMKDETKSEKERAMYDTKRNGTKLILNSASGAADAGFESNIRMNNKIISMRIIGQLFTYRIGQAQTLEGASIISTNTDGLFSVMEATRNAEILKRESAAINVEIKPEPIFLISKDSNNRAEVDVKDGQLADVVNASGSSLSCRKGPTPTQALAHPAILDWAVTEYLILGSIGYKGIGLDKPFNDEIGRSILQSARKSFNDDVKTLTMFQNVIASSPGSKRFVFATTDEDPYNPMPLQHYNRCFISKDGTPGTFHMKSAHAKVVTEAMLKKRKKNEERLQQHDPTAAYILDINGVKTSDIPEGKEATVVKISGVEEEWYMQINNSDLHLMEQSEIDDILDNLDYEKYLTLFRKEFMNNWFNLTPEYIMEQEREAAAAKEAAKKKPALLFGAERLQGNGKTDNNVSDSQTENRETQTESDKEYQLFFDDSNDSDGIENPSDQTPSTDTDPLNSEIEETEQVSSNSHSIPRGTEEDEAELERLAAGTPDITDGLALPKMIKLNRTLLSSKDIYTGEYRLHLNGIREADAHRVLRDLLVHMTDTDIDQ